jgi:hypothetical protein
VDDDGLEPGGAQEDDVLREGALERLVHHGVSAVLEDDDGAGEAPEPGQRLDEDGGLLLRGELCHRLLCHRLLRHRRGHVEYALFSWT